MTLRLAHVAIDHWRDLDGWAVSLRIKDLRTLPLDRFANLVWYWLTKEAGENDRKKLEAQLWQPPIGETKPIPPESPWSPESETAAFQSLKQSLGQ